jgi:RNA 2',3'-cyclic 3'-phosphodiesterase
MRIDATTIRAFLAIEPPQEVLRNILDIQNRLRRLLAMDIRWVKPEGMHLTLKFLGDIPEKETPAISSAAGEAASRVGNLHFFVSGLGVFPDNRRPRVVYLGLQGDTDRLASLQKNLEGILAGIGFPEEQRPFRAHLTLGRVKSTSGVSELAKETEKGNTCTAGEFTATELCLFRSDLTPHGAVYTRLAACPFAGGGRE